MFFHLWWKNIFGSKNIFPLFFLFFHFFPFQFLQKTLKNEKAICFNFHPCHCLQQSPKNTCNFTNFFQWNSLKLLAKCSRVFQNFQAIGNPLLQNYANFESIESGAIKNCVETFKVYEKARQMKKVFCSDNCAGYFLRKKFDPRLILVFPKLPQ